MAYRTRSVQRAAVVTCVGSAVEIAVQFEGMPVHGEPNGRFAVRDRMTPDQAEQLAAALLEAASVARRSGK